LSVGGYKQSALEEEDVEDMRRRRRRGLKCIARVNDSV
jgi:hypothetical protein